MPSNAELSALVDQLQAAVDTEQQEVADLLAEKEATIVSLNANVVTLGETIVALEAAVAAGGTEAERQAILDKLVAVKADIESTVTKITPEPEA